MDADLHRTLLGLIERHRDELMARAEAAFALEGDRHEAEVVRWRHGTGCVFTTSLEGYDVMVDYHRPDHGAPSIRLLQGRKVDRP